MKNAVKLISFIFLFIPFIYACQGVIEGEITTKNPSSGQCSEAASHTRIVTDTGETQCSGSDGLYSIEVSAGQNKKVTYRKSGHKNKEELVTVDNGQTVVKDVCLDADTPETSIHGVISWNTQQYGDPKNILVTLKSCSDCSCNGCTCETQIDSVLTCSDGNFSFPDLTEGTTYKIVPSYTGCQFSPANYTISIPQANPQSFNFSGTCQ